MTRCCVLKCKNDTSEHKKSSGITYHLFPKEAGRRAVWVRALGRGPRWSPTDSHRICSQHFTQDSFRTAPNGKLKMLRRDAVPTLHIPQILHQDDPIEFCEVESPIKLNKRNDLEPGEDDTPLVAKLKARIKYLELQNKFYKHKLAIVNQNNKRKTERMEKMKSLIERLVKLKAEHCEEC